MSFWSLQTFGGQDCSIKGTTSLYTTDTLPWGEIGLAKDSNYSAYTLSPADVTDLPVIDINDEKVYTRTHNDGWTIRGMVKDDYVQWINEFYATHEQYGRIWGDFEDIVYADSKEGFIHFFKNHTPNRWFYADI